MEFFAAPLEGITLCEYRKLHSRMFPGADAYYTPFIAPDTKGNFREKYLRELLPDNNEGIKLIPQLLVNAPEPFRITAEKLGDLGYDEVNLNTGCPSGTVFSKHKGAGMLADPEALDAFLDSVFSKTGPAISIKTRMGVSDTAEFTKIAEVFARYPLKRLIIHARAREGYYDSRPDLEGFAAALDRFPFPVCYNGNIFSKKELDILTERIPGVESVMVGRGLIADPALIRTLQGGEKLKAEELRQFHDELLEMLLSRGLAPEHALSHMKELWYYMIHKFTDAGVLYKRLNKTTRLNLYRSAVSELFSSGKFDPDRCFSGGRYTG